jgi:hypothetical protein
MASLTFVWTLVSAAMRSNQISQPLHSYQYNFREEYLRELAVFKVLESGHEWLDRN